MLHPFNVAHEAPAAEVRAHGSVSASKKTGHEAHEGRRPARREAPGRPLLDRLRPASRTARQGHEDEFILRDLRAAFVNFVVIAFACSTRSQLSGFRHAI
jgi:hypothetical protein